ncbi:MAG TPA: sensor histidine kinase [Bacteroidetes bacterium]|nr:sensor histidine kinase [Bacteroidota bacterium]
MFLKISLIISVLMQLGAAMLALGLIKKSKYNISWILLSTAFFLMAIRRIFEITVVFNPNIDPDYALINVWISVFISVLIFVGTFYIRQIFDLHYEVERLREQNEAKILTAVLKAEENERSKIAKDLHDGLAPLLSTAKIYTTAMERYDMSKNNLQLLEKMEYLINNSVETLKEISNHLSPHILVNFGLETALRKFIQNTSFPSEIKVIFETNLEKRRLKSNIEVILYRVACELITNSLKHSNCNKIDINLFLQEEEILFFYSDNGIGFDKDKLSEKAGMGLSNIYSRIKSVNGIVELKTGKKSGFFMKIKIPVEDEN